MKYRSILVALAALCLSAAGASAQVEVREAQLPAGISEGVKLQVLALASKDAALRARAACALGEARVRATARTALQMKSGFTSKPSGRRGK
ncbi:MAG TPA: hypothetical protein VF736_07390 [Pyrinomonadaceae bacterium]|jgi:hypothetical protein